MSSTAPLAPAPAGNVPMAQSAPAPFSSLSFMEQSTVEEGKIVSKDLHELVEARRELATYSSVRLVGVRVTLVIHPHKNGLVHFSILGAATTKTTVFKSSPYYQVFLALEAQPVIAETSWSWEPPLGRELKLPVMGNPTPVISVWSAAANVDVIMRYDVEASGLGVYF